jgi:anthranilate synthase/aminodeoxychorismate synthase-like glutamine amidotransferase
MVKVLLLDNYDSFTYNLYQYLCKLGAKVQVFKNDEITLDEIKALAFTHIVISPGPGSPHNPLDVGVCSEVIEDMYLSMPILGVCLGCQLISVVFGGKVVGAGEIVHGMRSKVKIDSSKLFEGLDSEIEVMRYHSLMVDEGSLPEVLRVTSSTEDGIIMSLEHNDAPLFGVQFHPESIGTETGHNILKNFLNV